jgi:DNA topoisomerase-1
MTLAQRLYEAGYITYMRTDSTNLSRRRRCRPAASTSVRTFRRPTCPTEAAVYSASDNAQEAHEAIRPSDVQVLQSQLANMERDAERLYELIWRQFVAGQMPAAEYTSTTITVAAADFELAARGRIVRFDGYTRVLPPQGRKGEDTVLPDLAPGDALKLLELHPASISPRRRRATAKPNWSASWRSAASGARRPTHRSFPRSRIAATCASRTGAFTPRRWARS